jgi:Mg-chelatase subunit ChlD
MTHEAACALDLEPELDKDPPGATIVAAVARSGRISVGWLGDSRAYWVTESGALALTQDDSLPRVGVAGSHERVLGFIADCSGSMEGLGRIEAVRNALGAAINALEPDTTFFIVGFDFDARVVFAPAKATATNKQLAHNRVAALQAGGGTAMSTGLEMALWFFRGFPKGINRALFLTDGKNESEKIDLVKRALADCGGVFECDCWGLGTDWHVGEVQEIARALNGHASLLPDRNSVDAAFRAFVDTAQSKALRDVRLRLWTPQGAELSQVRLLRQHSCHTRHDR